MAKLADLDLGTSKIEPFTFKRTKRDGSTVDVHVGIRALTKREHDVARANAPRTVRDLKPEGKTHDELIDEARIVEVLSIALRDIEDDTKPWAAPLELANMLSPEEISLLWMRYSAHQEACGPFVHDLTEEQFEAIVTKISEEGSSAPFFYFASPLQSAFITTLAKRHVMSRMESSSSSSASSEPSTSTESESLQSAATERDLLTEVDQLRDMIATLTVRLSALEAPPPHV